MPTPTRTGPTRPAPALTKAERDRAIAYHRLARTMRELEADLRWGLTDSLRIPAAWHEMLREPAAARKAKLTLRVDEDVAAFFRAMGPGHLARMNAVLRAFMLTRLAGVATGPEAVGYRPTPEEEAQSLRREVLATAEAELTAREEAARLAAERESYADRIAALRRLREERMRRE